MHGSGKSDSPIVPKKVSNKGTQTEPSALAAGSPSPPPAETLEGRGLTKGNALQVNRHRTQSRVRLQQDLERVRQVAVRDRTAQFTSIWHLVCDVDRLREAFYTIKRQSAAGIDGETKEEYEKRLDENLAGLCARLQSGAYHGKPVRRVYIPKADGRQRPIGIPALEDKIVQRATAEVLSAIYETDFHDFSYGFRPGRSQHDALDSLAVAINRGQLNWVLDADIRGFFDNIDQEWMLKFIKHRIADKRVWRHVQKWLQAGVLEDGKVHVAEYGTPQGGSISPLLANIYLHYAFDNWANVWQRKEATGAMLIVRYADDAVICFEHQTDAERFLIAMRERLSKFHLELNMDKTHLLEFGRKAEQNRRWRDGGRPETFDFLGFTHYCSRTRNGRFVVKRQTSRKKMQAKLLDLRKELRQRMHDPVPEVRLWLGRVLNGHYQYYAVPFNSHKLAAFRYHVLCLWQRSLARRSHKAKASWERATYLAKKYLPMPRTLHPYPEQRRRGVMT
jgi:RNA-directed DNA polymerase